MENKKTIFIKLENRKEAKFSLDDLRAASVFDTAYEGGIRPVLVTETGMWVRDGKTYDKYTLTEDLPHHICVQSMGGRREQAEQIGIAQDLDALEAEMKDYSQ